MIKSNAEFQEFIRRKKSVESEGILKFGTKEGFTEWLSKENLNIDSIDSISEVEQKMQEVQ